MLRILRTCDPRPNGAQHAALRKTVAISVLSTNSATISIKLGIPRFLEFPIMKLPQRPPTQAELWKELDASFMNM